MLRIILVLGTSVSLMISAVYDGGTSKETSATSPAVQPQSTILYVALEEEATTTTTSAPDLSLQNVDWVALARQTYGKCGEWYDTAMDAGWPKDQWPTISKVMWRESRCLENAWNGHDAGLMQINQVHKKRLRYMGMSFPDTMFVGYWNLVFARDLWERAGWEPWKFKGVVPG